jgi:hypothetical protein
MILGALVFLLALWAKVEKTQARRMTNGEMGQS